MPRAFGLDWAFEAFSEDPGFFSKRMFGGLAAYLEDRLVMVLAESPGEREYRGHQYPFEIWNGILLPTDRPHHANLMEQYPSLRPHPVLGKWLYLPMAEADFEETARSLSTRIAHRDPVLGVAPSSQKRKKTRKRKLAQPAKTKKTKKVKKRNRRRST